MSKTSSWIPASALTLNFLLACYSNLTFSLNLSKLKTIVLTTIISNIHMSATNLYIQIPPIRRYLAA